MNMPTPWEGAPVVDVRDPATRLARCAQRLSHAGGRLESAVSETSTAQREEILVLAAALAGSAAWDAASAALVCIDDPSKSAAASLRAGQVRESCAVALEHVAVARWTVDEEPDPSPRTLHAINAVEEAVRDITRSLERIGD